MNSWGYGKPQMAAWLTWLPGIFLVFVDRHSPRTCKLDFIQLPLNLGYQHVLLLVCMHSEGAEAFSCHRVGALIVAMKLLENVFPTWGVPSQMKL